MFFRCNQLLNPDMFLFDTKKERAAGFLLADYFCSYLFKIKRLVVHTRTHVHL